MAGKQVSILDGNTFCVSNDNGDIEATLTDPTGMFVGDTRTLSRWVLTINGERLNPLSTDDLQYFETRFFLVPGTSTVYVDAKLSVIRQRSIGGTGLQEQVTVLNHNEEPVDLTVRLEADSDFADLFEVKDNVKKKGNYERRAEDGTLTLAYRRDTFVRETFVSSTEAAMADESGLTMQITIHPHQEWTTRFDVTTGHTGIIKSEEERARLHQKVDEALPDMAGGLEKWLQNAPKLDCDWEWLNIAYTRSLIDLAALRFTPRLLGTSLPAAGLPWFMTIFGRDSIFTSLQALPYSSELAETTLRMLALTQGTRLDDFRDEDPGKMLHEFRFGEMAAFEERPHSPYYGTADATPLFVVLLDEYERWTGDRKLAGELEQAARNSLDWIDTFGDRNGDGYIEYKRRNEETGLENQCWKDSWDSISFHDGRLPGFPRSTCELQGYAYDAKTRGARLAREVWNDPEYADRLEREAADLKERFNRDFWIEEKQFYAVALDENGAQVDSLTSNIGHLLWSGIADDDKAKACVEHLMGPALFSGWGVRTLAEGEGRYNPVGYHTGTVWPFDNSIIAWGMTRYGYREEAARIAAGILEAARYFLGRLPEAFAGYPRAQTHSPVQYPTACSPQAWSTGTPLLLLRTMLGLDPAGEHLLVDPELPKGLGRVELLDITGRWGKADAFGRSKDEPPILHAFRPEISPAKEASGQRKTA